MRAGPRTAASRSSTARSRWICFGASPPGQVGGLYGQRLSAWGAHNQTVIILLAAIAENAWTRHVWHRHLGQPDASAALGPPPAPLPATA